MQSLHKDNKIDLERLHTWSRCMRHPIMRLIVAETQEARHSARRPTHLHSSSLVKQMASQSDAASRQCSTNAGAW